MALEKKKIMVVDDEEDFLRITKLNLEGTEKYEVKTLPNAKNIVEEFRAFQPDLLLLDMLMPTIGGIEVCEMLNKEGVAKNTPIIILSALDKKTDKLKAFKQGVVDYITKPIEKDTIIAKIEKALQYK